MSNRKKDDGYISTLKATAPAFALKALIGDLPKGAIESAVEGKIRDRKSPFGKQLVTGIKGRGLGRLGGSATGILLAPLFVKGIDLASSDKKSDRKKGIALLAANTAIYQMQKGLTEGIVQGRAAGLGKMKSVKDGALLGGIRSVYKLPAALAFGLGVAKGRESKKDKKSKFLLPALVGAGVGAGSRAIESTAKSMSEGSKFMKALKKSLPAAGGGAAGGILGGLVLAGAVDAALGGKTKKAAVLPELASLIGIHGGVKALSNYGTIGAATGRTRVGRKLQKGFQDLKSTHLAIGIKEGLAGRNNVGLRSSVLLNYSVPELKIERTFGLKIGKMLRGVPPQHRVSFLNKIKTQLNANPGAMTSALKEPTPVIASLPDAVDKVTGAKPMFKTRGQKIMASLVYGGRGGTAKGLPRMGVADSDRSPTKYLKIPKVIKIPLNREMLGDAITAAAGVPLAMASPFAAPMAAHGALSGVKSLVANSDYVQSKAAREMSDGIKDALFPGLKGTGDRNLPLQYLFSPAVNDFSRLTSGVTRGAIDVATKKALKSLQSKVVRSARKGNPIDISKMRNEIGAGLLAAGVVSHKMKNRRKKNLA